MKLIIRIVVNALALWLTTLILPAIQIEERLVSVLIVAVIFGIVNALIRPIITLMTLPINIGTLGLFTLVINAAMLGLTSWLAGARMEIAGATFWQQAGNALLGALIVSIISAILNWLLPDKDERK